MAKKGMEMVNVRIPQVLFDEISRVLNEVPITEPDGTITRVNEPYGLTNSNTAVVNTVLLSLLSSIIPTSRVALLAHVTPGVTMTYVNEAKKRLVPDHSLNIPVSEIVDIATRQREGFDRLAAAMEKIYVSQQQSDQQSLMDLGSLMQLLSYWVGANSQANVADSATFNDRSAIAVKKAIGVYGEQHVANFRLVNRPQKKDETQD